MNVPRYAPGAIVAPEVSPTVQPSRGPAMVFEATNRLLRGASDFIRPAVAREQQAKGERQALADVEQDRFSPRAPFTVRDQAFNAAGERQIGVKFGLLLEERIGAAVREADGNVEKLTAAMDKARAEVIGALPKDLPGLATELEVSFQRSAAVAQRQAVELTRRRVIAAQQQAAAEALAGVKAGAERLALTGATPAELATYLAQSAQALGQFGPPGGFIFDGAQFGSETASNVLSGAQITGALAEVARDAAALMLEADFERAEEKGAFVRDFKAAILSGQSPLPPGESLDLMRRLEGRARTVENAQRADANRVRAEIEGRVQGELSALMEVTEAGFPVPPSLERRAELFRAAEPYPDLTRQLRTELAVIDAAADVQGMSGAEVAAYAAGVRADLRAAQEAGVINLEAAAVLESLEDKLQGVRASVKAEAMGLPLIEQLIERGADVASVNYDGILEQFPQFADQILELRAFHEGVEGLRDLTADQRQDLIRATEEELARIVAAGQQLGAGGVMQARVLDRLEEWGQGQQKLAATDPVAYARARGIALPSLAEAQSMEEVSAILAQRIAIMRPEVAREGLANPVPLTDDELAGISAAYEQANRQQRMAFLSGAAALGEAQGMAVFDRFGLEQPLLAAAGEVYLRGNRAAAGLIMRGADVKGLGGDGPVELAAARQSALGDLLEADTLSDGSLRAIDNAAMAYARGVALAEGGRAVRPRDIQDGYKVALGRQEDGTGGPVSTSYGDTILPPGWDRRRFQRSLGAMDAERLADMAGGVVVGSDGAPYPADRLLRDIVALQPASDDLTLQLPLNRLGQQFQLEDGRPLILDLSRMAAWD